MIELVVVIAILAVLIGIAVPAVTAALENQRRNSTMATLKTLEAAIAEFARAKPLGRDRDYFGSLPPDYWVWEPSPSTYEAYTDSNSNGRWDPGEAIQNDQTHNDDEGYGWYNHRRLASDFPNISANDGVQRRIGGAWQPCEPDVAEGDYRSIESLYFYISQLSPTGAQILSRLSNKIVTNKDLCNGQPCPDKVILGKLPNDNADEANGKHIDLFEVRDAWDTPLRYLVRRRGGDQNPRFEWEIRSAGPDGVFGNPDPARQPPNAFPYEAMFTDQDESDDVFLRGE